MANKINTETMLCSDCGGTALRLDTATGALDCVDCGNETIDNEYTVSVLEKVRDDLFHKRHGTADLELKLLITTLRRGRAR